MTNEVILSSAPRGLVDAADIVDGILKTLMTSERGRWALIDENLGLPFDSLFAMVISGGKRIRPGLCYAAFIGSGGDRDDETVQRVMTALELLHTFALLHDDIMDGSSMRRGNLTVHEEFAAYHSKSNYRGESRRFGDGVGILAGDLAFVYADIMIEEAPIEVRKIYSELRLEVNIGQYLDLLGTARCEPTVDMARKINIYKSGKYTIERPMHVGAVLCGKGQEELDQLSDFGLPLGEAFQLQDDILGVFGDDSLTGKPVGDDLREGKPTELVAEAINLLNGKERVKFAELFRQCQDSTDAIAEVMAMIEHSGARSRIEQRIDLLIKQSLRALDNSYLNDEGKELLHEIALYIAHRQK